MCWVVILGLTTSVLAQTETATTRPAASTAPAATPTKAGPKIGTVTGSSVYVRSGSEQNYYAVTKLNRGDEVTVVGERYGWLEILPPKGVFSVVDKNYVDPVDDKTGVLNGRTWVQAGSLLVDRHYANQVKLSKGDRVHLLGETPDGKFYKIAPPRNAHLWISGDFVASGQRPARPDGEGPPSIEPVKPGELDLVGDKPDGEKPVAKPPTLPPAPTLPGLDKDNQHHPIISTIEADIAAEKAKQVKQQNMTPILDKLKPLAVQTDDTVVQLYAQTRIRQLQSYVELIEAVEEMHSLHAKALTKAELLRQQRAKIKAEAAFSIDDIAVRGEVRVSSIYNGSGNRSLRWRIVERGVSPARTLAYIEVPKGSPIDPIQYYGRYIGVRASARRVMRGANPPLPIYTVQEIEVLNPTADAERTGGSAVTASPTPRKVAAPSTRPAESAPKPTPDTDAKQ